MGGGSDSGGTQVISPNSSNDPTLLAVQNPLMSASIAQLAANDQFNPYGRGSNLTPLAPFGQVYFPGPNQTIIGNPYNPNNLAPFYGQSAAAPQNVGFNSNLQGGGAQGGSGQGGGGGMGYPQNVQTAINGAAYPHAQQVLSPFQQFFPSILPVFGTPSGAQGAPQSGSQGSQGGAQSPRQGGQQPQGNWAYLPGQGQQQQTQPQQQQQQAQSAPQQGQSPAPAQQQTSPLSPQQQAQQQWWIQQLQSAGANPFAWQPAGLDPMTGAPTQQGGSK